VRGRRRATRGSNDNNKQSEEKMLRSVVLASIVLACGHLIAGAVWAETPHQILAVYAAQAKTQNPSFAGFSAERGEALYIEPHMVKGAGMVSCSSCHLKDARYSVLAHQTDIPCRTCHVINDWEHPDPKHAKKRHIEPFAPSANPKRLSDPRYVETFLRLNCRLLLDRDCTTLEKGDVLTYLIAIEGGNKGDLINVGSRALKRAAAPQ
jgi:Domain of unknown function (DUF1924)